MSKHIDYSKLFNEYLSYYELSEKKYGKNTVVFMQVGAFYEIYGTYELCNIIDICNILNVQPTRKQKECNEVSCKNPLFWGYNNDNIATIKKFEKVLLANYYTVVYVDQVGDKTDNNGRVIRKERAVTSTVSLGTNSEPCENNINNNLVCIYIEEIDKKLYQIGMSLIDVTTGKSTVHECSSTITDENTPFQEATRFIEENGPVEIIIYTKHCSLTEDDLEVQLGIENYQNKHYYLNNKIDNTFTKVAHQNEFLKKVFPNHGFLSPIEHIDLEKKPIALLSYILLLQFSYEHDSNIVKRIDKPVVWDTNDHLLLVNTCIEQLNLLPKEQISRTNSLLGVINNTSTSFGKRHLKYLLLNPIVDVNELNKRYNIIEKIIPEVELYDNVLKGILDLERLHRKLTMQRIQPYDFVALDSSYQKILNLIDLLKNIFPEIITLEDTDITLLKQLVRKYNDTFDMDVIGVVNLQTGNITPFLKRGKNPKIDSIFNELDNIEADFQSLLNEYSKLCEGSVKICKTEKSGRYLSTSKVRANTLKKNLHPDKLKELKFTTQSNNVKITSDYISRQSDKEISLKEKLKRQIKITFYEIVGQFDTEYSAMLQKVVNFVAEIDTYKSSAKTAKELSYCKPVAKENKSSFIVTKNLRHAIVECIHTSVEYVPNDISIGKIPNEVRTNGMLIYGANSCGKSTLLKSVGIGVVMAQAGMFVPAESFVYSPFNSLISRIGNLDNIFKGQSTFVVEMTELNTIVKRADRKTLVLGDEICAGTEQTSGLSIVAATVEILAKRKSNFMFATHLHKLSKLDNISSLKNVVTKHLKVTYNSKNATLEYNRTLQDGNGPEVYGLEVAKHIISSTEFHYKANEIRNILINGTDKLIDSKESRYNTDVLLTNCSVCLENKAEHTHHIKFQKDADIDGKIGVIHKNRKSNLVGLCEECHTDLHNGEFVINGWKQTTDGVVLDWKELVN